MTPPTAVGLGWDAGTGHKGLHPRGRSTWPGARFMMLSSHQSCFAGRLAVTGAGPPSTQQPAAIHPFIRPFVAWGTREGAQLMHRVLRVINAPLRDSAAGATHLHSYSTQHLSSTCLQYLPALAGASSFCLIPTYYEIGRDGEGTHHAGVFHSGPISLQLPVLHMRSSQSVSQ